MRLVPILLLTLFLLPTSVLAQENSFYAKNCYQVYGPFSICNQFVSYVSSIPNTYILYGQLTSYLPWVFTVTSANGVINQVGNGNLVIGTGQLVNPSVTLYPTMPTNYTYQVTLQPGVSLTNATVQLTINYCVGQGIVCWPQTPRTLTFNL